MQCYTAAVQQVLWQKSGKLWPTASLPRRKSRTINRSGSSWCGSRLLGKASPPKGDAIPRNSQTTSPDAFLPPFLRGSFRLAVGLDLTCLTVSPNQTKNSSPEPVRPNSVLPLDETPDKGSASLAVGDAGTGGDEPRQGADLQKQIGLFVEMSTPFFKVIGGFRL